MVSCITVMADIHLLVYVLQRPKIPSDCPERWPAVIEAGWKHKKEVLKY